MNIQKERELHAAWYKKEDPVAFSWYEAESPEYVQDFGQSEKAWLAAKAQAFSEWISVEDHMPEPLRNVLVLIDANPVKNQNRMVAHYIPQFCEAFNGDDDWYDWSEEKQCRFVKQGWYANTAYIGDEYSSYFIEEKVTHWRPLI